MGCQYFNADWSLPNLNNRPLSETEKLKHKLIMESSRLSKQDRVNKVLDNLGIK